MERLKEVQLRFYRDGKNNELSSFLGVLLNAFHPLDLSLPSRVFQPPPVPICFPKCAPATRGPMIRASLAFLIDLQSALAH